MESNEKKTGDNGNFNATQGLYVGKSINDKYIIERELGEGGMGLTYVAYDADNVNRKVVIKTIHKELSTPEGKAIFLKEGEALGRINHDGVVRLFDKGEDRETGLPFLVMEYVEGRPLSYLIELEKISLKKAINITEKIALALTAAHKKRVLHRDLKPENIMIIESDVEGEKVKLIDFGVAKVADSVVGIDTTQIGSFKGTLQYASPEQLSGLQTVGGETYNLALLTYELLTQERPFPITVKQEPNESKASLYGRAITQIRKLQKEGAENPQNYNAQIPEKTAEVLLKGLEYDLNDRYDTPIEFSDALGKSLEDETVKIDKTEPKGSLWKIMIPIAAIFILLFFGLFSFILWDTFDNKKILTRNSDANSSQTPTITKKTNETLFNYSFEVQKMKNNIIDGKTFTTADSSQIDAGDKFNLIVEREKQGSFYIIKQRDNKIEIVYSNSNKNVGKVEGWHVSNPNQSFWLIWSKDKIEVLEQETVNETAVKQFLQSNKKNLDTDEKSGKIEVTGNESIGVYQLKL